MRLPSHVPPFIPCPHCGSGLKIEQRHYDDYFHGANQPCPGCATPLDWWEVVLNYTSDTLPLLNLFVPVGGRSTVFRLVLRPSSLTTMNLYWWREAVPSRILWEHASATHCPA